MRHTIYKYQVDVLAAQSIKMNQDAHILSVQVQETKLCIWAAVDSTRPLVHRNIAILGTGHHYDGEIPVEKHLGTVQLNGYVWHLFDLGET